MQQLVMDEIADCGEETLRLVKRRRRLVANRRTWATGCGAFLLGWSITAVSILATVDEDRRDAAITVLGTGGFVILAAVLILWALVSAGRWAEERAAEAIRQREDAGLSNRTHFLLASAYLVGFSLALGWLCSLIFGFGDTSKPARTLIFGLTFLLVLLLLSFTLIPVDLRRTISRELAAENARAVYLAAYSPGELELFRRLQSIEEKLEARMEAPLEPIVPQLIVYKSWGAWWRARPRRNRSDGSSPSAAVGGVATGSRTVGA